MFIIAQVSGINLDGETRTSTDLHTEGTLRAFLSGRISYAFKFKGPSIVIDTACSSSTVALYEACKALRSGDCTAALAMGVNTMTSPDVSLLLSVNLFFFWKKSM